MSEQSNQNLSPPAGTYSVKCIDHGFGVAGTGSKQIGIRLQITEGPYAGQLLSYYGTFTERAEEYTIKAMRALGWEGLSIRGRGMAGMYTKEALAVVDHEKNLEGEMVVKVNWINSKGVVMKETMDDRELERFEREMRASFAKYGGGGSGNGRRNDDLPPLDDRGRNGDGRRGDYDNRRDDDRRGSSYALDERRPPPPRDDDRMPWDERGGRR